MKNFLIAIGSMSVMLAAPSAFAGAGRATNVDASGRFAVVRWTQPAGTFATVETTALQGTVPDTVLYVFDEAMPGQYFAGNDDRSSSDYSSIVTLANFSSTARNRVAIVRAYASSRAGTGTLKVTTTPGVVQTWPIVFDGGEQVPLGSYSPNMHVVGVERQRGASDVMVLLVDQAHSSRAYATAFDDDSGLGLMPFIHANEGCSSGASCLAIVGRPWFPGSSPAQTLMPSPSPTTLLWDPDMHVSWADPDSDGLSTSLETVLGTQPVNDDSDQDGVKDGVEVMGGADTLISPGWMQVRFPYFGASPTQKDVFVQADWQRCDHVPADPSTWRDCVPYGATAPSFDRYRISPDDAERVVQNYVPANISVHLDIGVDPPRPAPLVPPPVSFKYGAWGGAMQRPSFNTDHCQFRAASRDGTFHFYRISGLSGGQSFRPGACGTSSIQPWDLAHELGHNLNQDHSARFAGAPLNGAPNYVSIMNYGYSGDRGGRTPWPFADGTYNSWVLNPSAMDEATPAPAELRATLSGDFQFRLDSTGRVDWNRDGQFSNVPVKAEASWFYDLGAWKKQAKVPSSAADSFTPGSAIAWLGASAGHQPRMLWFVRKLDGLILYSTPNTFPTASCLTCDATWTANPTLPPPAVSGVSDSPAAARLSYNGSEEVVLAVPTSDNAITLYRGSWQGGALQWVPKVVKAANTSPVVTGGLAVLVDGENVVSYATTFDFSDGYRVHEYSWNLASNVVTDAIVTAGGTPIVPDGYGAGATMGYAPPSPGPAGAVVKDRVLVVPIRNTSPEPGTTLYASKLHVYLRRPGTWQELPPISNEGTFGAQPSIAYVPLDDATPELGRFYVTFRSSARDATGFAADRKFHMVYSEGNQPWLAPYQQMAWTNPSAQIRSEWEWAEKNVALSYDPQFFPRLQMAYSYYNNDDGKHFFEAHFAPYADNIIPVSSAGQSDLPSLRGGLRCALIPSAPCQCETPGTTGCQ